MRPRFLLVLSAVGLSLAANAEQVHKWVDAEGKVHYSDQPAPDKSKDKTLTITTKPLSGANEKPATQGLAEKEQEFRKRKAAEAEAKAKQEKSDAEAKKKAQNCEQARNNLRTVQEGGRIVRYNEAGEREYLDDTGRQQAIVDAQKSVEEWCK